MRGRRGIGVDMYLKPQLLITFKKHKKDVTLSNLNDIQFYLSQTLIFFPDFIIKWYKTYN